MAARCCCCCRCLLFCRTLCHSLWKVLLASWLHRLRDARQATMEPRAGCPLLSLAGLTSTDSMPYEGRRPKKKRDESSRGRVSDVVACTKSANNRGTQLGGRAEGRTEYFASSPFSARPPTSTPKTKEKRKKRSLCSFVSKFSLKKLNLHQV